MRGAGVAQASQAIRRATAVVVSVATCVRTVLDQAYRRWPNRVSWVPPRIPPGLFPLFDGNLSCLAIAEVQTGWISVVANRIGGGRCWIRARPAAAGVGRPPRRTPAISKHLKVLERAGLIAKSTHAQWRLCRLEAAPLREVADWMERYRRFWDESFSRLDEHLRHMQRDKETNER